MEWISPHDFDNGAKLSDKNKYGFTVLQHAAIFGNVNAVRILCQAGSNVNDLDNDNNTALMHVVNSPHIVRSEEYDEFRVEIIRILHEAGADVNMKDNNGDTALHMACREQHNLKVMRTLVEIGADVNARNNGSDTPLITFVKQIAVENTPIKEIEEIIGFLISHGANPHIPDDIEAIYERYANPNRFGVNYKGKILEKLAIARAATGTSKATPSPPTARPSAPTATAVSSNGCGIQGCSIQGGGSRRGKGRKTRGKGKKAKGKGKAKGKTRKARS